MLLLKAEIITLIDCGFENAQPIYETSASSGSQELLVENLLYKRFAYHMQSCSELLSQLCWCMSAVAVHIHSHKFFHRSHRPAYWLWNSWKDIHRHDLGPS